MKIISDTLQPANPMVLSAIRHEDPEPIRRIVRSAIEKGIHGIDINCGPLPKQPERKMTFLVETVQAETRLPLFLDTTNSAAIEAGLKICQNPVIINGLSLEPHKVKNILPLASAYDVDVIGFLLTPEGQVPTSLDERIGIAVALFDLWARTGLAPQRLIIDPIVAPLMWADGLQMNRDLLSILKLLPQALNHPVRTIAGLSNLTAGIRNMDRKIALESAFVSMMAQSGLDWVLMNVERQASCAVAAASNLLMYENVFA
ncbi:MAG: dihydropteroate synthase [Thermodesulfobacteriota bacterium]